VTRAMLMMDARVEVGGRRHRRACVRQVFISGRPGRPPSGSMRYTKFASGD
jgi:hypothetical protein